MKTTFNRDAPAAWAFLAPTLLLVIVFTVAPALFALYASFHKMDIVSGRSSFAGLQNFLWLVDDEKFWAACRNTLRYVLVVVPLQTVLALVLACLLNGRVRFKRGFPDAAVPAHADVFGRDDADLHVDLQQQRCRRHRAAVAVRHHGALPVRPRMGDAGHHGDECFLDDAALLGRLPGRAAAGAAAAVRGDGARRRRPHRAPLAHQRAAADAHNLLTSRPWA